jgi:4-amino-4-deoxy-L-arabinose transferase-like glycosyltransferase
MAEALLFMGIILNVVFWVVVLVILARDRHSVELRQILKWAFLLALLPGLGLLGIYLERSESYGMFFVVILIALVFLGLFVLARDRHSMKTRQVVKWAILVVILPGLGTLGYFFWRFENSERHGTSDRRGEAAPFLRKPTSRER